MSILEDGNLVRVCVLYEKDFFLSTLQDTCLKMCLHKRVYIF